MGTTALFNIDEGADSKDSKMTRCTLTQSGLGLPDRDYYFDEDKAEKREAYIAHLVRTLDKISSVTGLEPGEATAAAAEQVSQSVSRSANSTATTTATAAAGITTTTTSPARADQTTPAILHRSCRSSSSWPPPT